jgi:FemAB-related protein (PEP-CTERM system-associated)
MLQVMRVKDECCRELWNNFIKEYPCSTPYHLWEFGEAFSLTYGYERYYITLKDKNRILGVFPLILIKSTLFGNKLISLPFCEYGGPIINPSLDSETQQKVISFLLNGALKIFTFKNLDYLEIRSPVIPIDLLKKLMDFKFSALKRYVTFRVNLSRDEEDLWKSLDKKTRNSIKKAIKSNLEYYEINKYDDLRKYFSLYLKTQKKHGSPPHSFKLFENFFRLMKENIKILLAETKGMPIAGIIIFCNKPGMYWWNNVSDPKFRELNATNLLLWKVIQYGREKGYKYLDLGRTRIGGGVYHFKRGWGGREIPLEDYLYSVKGNIRRTPDPSEGIYLFLIKIWARLPLSVSKAVGPRIIKQIGL